MRWQYSSTSTTSPDYLCPQCEFFRRFLCSHCWEPFRIWRHDKLSETQYSFRYEYCSDCARNGRNGEFFELEQLYVDELGRSDLYSEYDG